MKFEGTAQRVATPDPTVAVNATSTPERPLRVNGEPGTGKSELARPIAVGLALLSERPAFIARGRGT